MKIKYLIMTIVLVVQWSCKKKSVETHPEIKNKVEFNIMFGSCANQEKKQPLLNIVTKEKPDAFIYLGDNIYADTHVMDSLRARYGRLAAKTEFQQLLSSTTVFATWDDHDFGWNDAGRHYPFKEESKEIFMDFWKIPETSDRRKHEGIYGVEYLEKEGKKVQILLLDTRTFRDDLVKRAKTDSLFKNDYKPNLSPDSTFLGEEQWQWLEEQLKQPADFRLVASSNQFSHEYNGWESWTNVPHERQRFIDLIKKTEASLVVFISGDVHWGEISKQEVEGGYPMYDITSSGITQTWHVVEPNKNRIGKAFAQNNLGKINLTWGDDSARAHFSIIDSTEKAVGEHEVELDEISF